MFYGAVTHLPPPLRAVWQLETHTCYVAIPEVTIPCSVPWPCCGGRCSLLTHAVAAVALLQALEGGSQSVGVALKVLDMWGDHFNPGES